MSSNAKKFYFGTLYKLVFKMTSKYIIYIAYVECGTKDVKIYDTQEVDHFNSAPPVVEEDLREEAAQPVERPPMMEGGHSAEPVPLIEGRPIGGDLGEAAPMMEGGHFGGDMAEAAPMEGGHRGGDFGETISDKSAPQARLKGFARPNASAN